MMCFNGDSVVSSLRVSIHQFEILNMAKFLVLIGFCYLLIKIVVDARGGQFNVSLKLALVQNLIA